MGLISITGIADGTLANADDVNSRVATILGLVNGNIEAANIKNASITNPLLADDSVATANIQDGSVTREKIASSATTITSDTTITPDAQLYIVTALASNATIAAPSGTPYSGQPLVIRIKDNGTTRTLTWNSAYRVIGVTLPTATVANKVIYVAGRYNTEDAKWDIIGVGRQS